MLEDIEWFNIKEKPIEWTRFHNIINRVKRKRRMKMLRRIGGWLMVIIMGYIGDDVERIVEDWFIM